MAIYLNNEPVEKIPEQAMQTMAERLSFVVSTYFSNHPDEYVRFLEGQKRRRMEAEAAEREREIPKKRKRPAKA